MAPKYRYFEKELRGFLANVYKIRLQMLNSANLDSLDDEARNAYEWSRKWPKVIGDFNNNQRIRESAY